MFQEIAAVLGPRATRVIATSALPGAPVLPVPPRRPSVISRPRAGRPGVAGSTSVPREGIDVPNVRQSVLPDPTRMIRWPVRKNSACRETGPGEPGHA